MNVFVFVCINKPQALSLATKTGQANPFQSTRKQVMWKKLYKEREMEKKVIGIKKWYEESDMNKKKLYEKENHMKKKLY